jgi:hypothetical protein
MIQAYLKNLFGPLGAVAVNTTTLDPLRKAPLASLSNGNLGMINLGGGHSPAYSTTSHSSGLLYLEDSIGNAAGNPVIGIGNASLGTATGTFPGQDLNSIGYVGDGSVRINNVTVATLATYSTGLFSMALDLTHSKIWFRIGTGGWNNDVIANQNPATNTGGISISTLNAGPYFAVLTQTNFGDYMTVNFGSHAYADESKVPAGFGNW